MKKPFLFSVVVCILITACGGQRSIPTTIPSISPEPSSTIIIASPTLISTPTRIQPTDVPSTPTFTPFPPYHTKNVVFEYFELGQLSDYGRFYADYREIPNIILYDDGQMLINGRQKELSKDQINQFLSKLDTMGFFSLESNQKHDPTDKLYEFGNNYQRVADGLKYCILVNAERSKNLCVQDVYVEYLIPEMKAILEYLDGYKPVGMTPYSPDRILLSIQPTDTESDDLSATATPWDNRFPSLDFPPPIADEYYTPPYIIYIEGDMAKDIYTFIANSQTHGAFIQDDKRYIVEVDVVLPHETIINGYQ